MEEKEAERVQEKIKLERKPKKLKRFYKKASRAGNSAPYGVKLDGRELKTPMKNALNLPTRKLAQAIVAEWNAQQDFVESDKMFLTKFANTAIDRVELRREEIIDEIVAFASSDLLCYRAEAPQGLADRQNRHWDPVLDWAKTTHGLEFVCVGGIVYAKQPDETLIKTHGLLSEKTSYELTAIHNLTTMLGSALLALAVCDGFLDAESCWEAGHVDENWNMELWGADEDAIKRNEFRRAEFDEVLRFYALSSQR